MDPVTLTNLALAVALEATKAAQAAQAGDLATARQLLSDARARYDSAVAAWDAAAVTGDDQA